MNAAQSPRRPITAVVLQSLMWLWLISLSVFVALGYRAVNEQADQKRLDTRLQRLEALASFHGPRTGAATRGCMGGTGSADKTAAGAG